MAANNDRAQAVAFKEFVDAQMASPWGAYDFDELPKVNGKPPAIYVLISVQRRFGGTRRVTGNLRGTGWYGTATAVGRTVDECRRAMEAVGLIENVRLTVAGQVSSPVSFNAATAAEPDDGVYSATSTWTWAF